MKQLFAGVLLILILGLGAFLYRNVTEKPMVLNNTACTLEVKMCPDGSSVGRSGPSCSFAPCGYPNIEIAEAGISFLLPEGYVVDENSVGANPDFFGGFTKESASGSRHLITVQRYPLNGATAEAALLQNTRLQPADMAPESIDELTRVDIGGRTFYTITIERFEALVHTSYFLVRDTDIVRFDIVEHDVVDWMNPDLLISDLPEHRALRQMLETLQAM